MWVRKINNKTFECPGCKRTFIAPVFSGLIKVGCPFCSNRI